MTADQLDGLILRAYALGKQDDREEPTFTGMTVKAVIQDQPIPFEMRGLVWHMLRQAYLWGAFVARYKYNKPDTVP